MNHRRSLSLVLFATVAVTAYELPAQRPVEDARGGYRLTPPKDWVQLPAHDERGSVIGLFCAERPTPTKSGGLHLPVLRVVRLRAGDAAADAVDGLPRRTPLRDLDDWIARGHAEPCRLGTREAVDVGGTGGQRYEATLPHADGERTLLGLVVPAGDGHLLVEFEVLAEQAAKLNGAMRKTLHGVALLEPSGAAVEAPWRADPTAWAAASADERRTQRAAWAEAVTAAAAAAPEAGFQQVRDRDWVVLSNASPSDAKRVVDAARAARAWCEKHLAGLEGEDLPAVLRIYSAPHHLQAVWAEQPSPGEFDPETRTLHFAIDPSDRSAGSYGPVFRAVVWQWIDDRAPGTARAAPRWLDTGLWEYFRSTRLKGRNIDFSPGDVENGRFDYHARNDSLPAIWDLVQELAQPSPEDGAEEEPWGYTPECARLMRWLFEHGGQAAFGASDWFTTYLRTLGQVVQELGPDPTADVAWARLDDEQAKAARSRRYAWRGRVLGTTNDRAVTTEEAVWRALDAKWREFVADF